MKLTLKDILEANQGLRTLLTLKGMPIKQSWKIASLAKAMDGQLALYREELKKIFEKHGVEMGKPSTPEDNAKMEDDIGVLQDQEVEIDSKVIELSESTEGLVAGDLVGLIGIVVITDAKPDSTD